MVFSGALEHLTEYTSKRVAGMLRCGAAIQLALHQHGVQEPSIKDCAYLSLLHAFLVQRLGDETAIAVLSNACMDSMQYTDVQDSLLACPTISECHDEIEMMDKPSCLELGIH